MKNITKLLLSITLLTYTAVQISADDKMLIYKNTASINGILTSKIDSLNFDATATKLNIYNSDTTITSIPLSTIDSILVKPVTTIAYTPPSLPDDYSSIAGYSSRGQWQLANIHDPTVVKFGDYFYISQTDASYGNSMSGYGHYALRRSKDLVNWTFLGFAMPNTPPTWIKDSLNAIRTRYALPVISSPGYGFWAPVMRKVGNKVRMYYSVIIDNYIKTGLPNTAANFDNSWTERAFIGMMETSTPQIMSSWVDKGYVTMSSSDKGTNWSRASTNDWSAYFKWNAIDPTYQITPEGKHWLIYGSWHSGIVAVEVDSTSGKLKKTPVVLADYGTRIARRQNNDANRWQGQEGPEMIYNPVTGYYYLFLAYDELSVNYNTRVCRAKSPTGPFYGFGSSNITLGADCFPIITHPYKFNNHSGWVGFSHCSVFQDSTTGQWYYVSQARLPANTNGNAYSNAIMMGHLRKIKWTDDGWPVVLPERYANVPQTLITDEDLVGNWEVIVLDYVIGVQQTSINLNLAKNYQCTGKYTGTWSYNGYTKTLTVKSSSGSSIKFKVERELDWEASPRVPTIVFAGLNSTGRSVWGKKSK